MVPKSASITPLTLVAELAGPAEAGAGLRAAPALDEVFTSSTFPAVRVVVTTLLLEEALADVVAVVFELARTEVALLVVAMVALLLLLLLTDEAVILDAAVDLLVDAPARLVGAAELVVATGPSLEAISKLLPSFERALARPPRQRRAKHRSWRRKKPVMLKLLLFNKQTRRAFPPPAFLLHPLPTTASASLAVAEAKQRAASSQVSTKQGQICGRILSVGPSCAAALGSLAIHHEPRRRCRQRRRRGAFNNAVRNRKSRTTCR